MNLPSSDSFKSTSTLEISHFSSNLKISSLSKVACDQRIKNLDSFAESSRIFWSAETYGLQRSALFQNLTEEQKQLTLQMMSQLRLSLAWYIEKVGLAYCSRALLECDSHEEKRLYALMAADEAVHQRMIEHFLLDGKPITDLEKHPLLSCIAEVIENAHPMAAVYVVQILLEGFGMSYYSQLRSTSSSPALAAAFDQILKDEARHHGGGLARFAGQIPAAETIQEAVHYTRKMVEAMNGVGFTAMAIEAVLGRKLETAEKKQLLEETEWTRQAPMRLKQIQELIRRHDSYGIYDSLNLEVAQ